MEIKCHSKYIPWIKRSILVAGIIPMLALTISDLIPLLKDYNDIEKNVLTQVSVEMNRSIPRPNITICVHDYSRTLAQIGEWYKRGSDPDLEPPAAFTEMKDHSWDDIWETNVTSLETLDEVAAKIVKRIVTMNEDDQLAMLYGTSHKGSNIGISRLFWQRPIIDAIWMYLVRVIWLDRSLTPPYMLDGNKSNETDFMHDAIFAQTGQVSNKQMDQLFNRVLEAFLPRYYFESNLTVPSVSTTTLDGDALFCFQPSSTDTVVESDGSTFFSFLFRSDNFGNLLIFEESSIMYASLGDVLYVAGSTSVAETTRIYREQMTLTYAIRSRVNDTRTDRVCTNDISPAVCFANHQVNLTIEYCQCIPFTYRSLRDNPDNLSYCSLVHYESCGEQLMESAKKNMDSCSRKCENTFYQWNEPTTILKDWDGHPSVAPFELIIKPFQQTPYLEFKITDKINLHEFFSQLGGSIGFYLGFSCLTGFGIIGLLVEYIIKRYEARKGPDTTENGTNSVWTFLWTKNFINILAGRAEENIKKRKMECICEELNELKKENSQLRNLIDHKITENEKHDQIRDKKMGDMDKKMDYMDQKMEYMDQKTDEMAKKMGNMDRRMENLSKEFMKHSELVMTMLVQLKNGTETSKQQTQ